MSPAAGPTKVRHHGRHRARSVLELYLAGLDVAGISHRLGLQSSTIRRILRDAGVIGIGNERTTKGVGQHD